MGYAYHANYLRWFEIGRTEFFRSYGLPYKNIEANGIFLPVSEVQCKFVTPVQYDDAIIVETTIDTSIKAGIKFNYILLTEQNGKVNARGYTLHACVNKQGQVVRPPEFLKSVIKKVSR